MNINERVEIVLTRHDLDLVQYQNGQIKALRWARRSASAWRYLPVSPEAI
jgi:hypothetical protein